MIIIQKRVNFNGKKNKIYVNFKKRKSHENLCIHASFVENRAKETARHSITFRRFFNSYSMRSKSLTVVISAPDAKSSFISK